MEFHAQVWARDSKDVWQQGSVISREEAGDKRIITVRFSANGEEAVYKLTAAQADEGEGAKDIKLRNVEGQSGTLEGAGIDDLVVLTHLHEPAILYTLEERYNNNIIYTYTGPILLAINPFCRIPLYGNNILEKYRNDGKLKIRDPDYRSELAPHVYATADNAYRLMTHPSSDDQKRNQSILVSGESGAGKTETTKIIMRYLAILGGHDAKAILESDSSVVSIEQQVLQSNPILEAFGNARTVRNDNSSRFGKFIEIDFDKDGFLIGAAIRTFLLEKIRLVHTSEHERNFHVFYQMIAGAPKESRAQWKLLSDPRKYHYINQSKCYTRRDGVKDGDLWAELEGAMKVMGMSDEESESVFKCTAAILHCGNMDFENKFTSKNDEPRGEILEKTKSFANATAELWEVEIEDLLSAMTKRSVKAGREWFTMYLDANKCRHGRDALCKSVFSNMFDWLVAKINDTIDKQRKSQRATSSHKAKSFNWDDDSYDSGPVNNQSNMFIGLLDIFGFESFEHNYYEQFLINYANEKLQQQFNYFVFEMEQEEYKKEKIRWDFIEFPDNKDSIELIENKPAGILCLLDDQCIAPRATDQSLANNLYRFLDKHPRFKSGHDLRVDFKFMVHHYAGDITYETEGFLEKNRDSLHSEGIKLINSSSSEFIRELVTEDATPTATQGSHTPKHTKNSNTVGAQFRTQLNSLLTVIEDTHPHYVRCLKPNDKNIKSCFDVTRITSQLANGGVLAAVHVARAGFPVRMQHSEFIARYKILFPSKVQRAWTKAKRASNNRADQEFEVCKILITECLPVLSGAGIPNDKKKKAETNGLSRTGSFRDLCSTSGVQMGITKVFFRQVAFNRAEKARTICMADNAIKIQAICRGRYKRKAYLFAKAKFIILQARVRGGQARKRYKAARELRAAILIQTFVRCRIKRLKYLKQKQASIKVQTFYRFASARKKFVLTRHRLIIIQCRWRQKVAMRQLVELKKEAANVLSLQAQIEAFERKMKEQQEAMQREQELAIKRALEEAEIAKKKAEEDRKIAEEKAKKDAEAKALREAEEEKKRQEDAKKRAEEEAEIARARAARIAAEEAEELAAIERRRAQRKADEEAENARRKAEEEERRALYKAELEAERERMRAEAAAELAREREAAEEMRKMLAAQQEAQKKLEEEKAAAAAALEEKKRLEEEEAQRAEEEARKAEEEANRRRSTAASFEVESGILEDEYHRRLSGGRFTPSRVDTEQLEFERMDSSRMNGSLKNHSVGTSRYGDNRYGNGPRHRRSRSHAQGRYDEMIPEPFIRNPHMQFEDEYGYPPSIYSRSINDSPRSTYPESMFSDGFLDQEDLEKLSISIDRAYVSQLGRSAKPYVLYRIRVKTSRHRWTVDRRFSDFLWLHDVLVDAFSETMLPRLPAKRFFGDQLDREFIEMRRLFLENYLVALLAQKGHWLTERNVNCVEVGIGFNRRMVTEAVAKQSFIAFLDRRQANLFREDESILSNIGSSLCTIFTFRS
mmetsp:Transcript_19374/g.28663  ORF Transcript_19374/g.28663 Transcript_19374/m.28663 type:complete len:1499 (+) Transcript_19374:129-4625(+)